MEPPAAPPPAPRRSLLLAVLFVLIAGIVAVTAFGVTLILQRDQPTSATPPRASGSDTRRPAPERATPPQPTPTATARRPTVRPTPVASSQTSRRIELQADCLMATTGIAVRTTRLSATDRDEMKAWRTAVPDEIHGKAASQLFWINRGFGTDGFGRCSTWTATKHIG